MRFFIAKNPIWSLLLIPWLVPCSVGGQTIGEMYLDLRNHMEDEPDRTFVCICIERDRVRGITIAWCREHDVLIWQASSDRQVPGNVVDHAFRGILHWAKSMGFNRVSGVPNRARKIWQRRWGFRPSETNDQEVFVEI